MQIHNLKRITPNKDVMLVGRGGKRGKTSGRGTKGQNARAGRKKRPEIRDIIKRIPKLRGRGVSPFKPLSAAYFPVNLVVLEKISSAGDVINPAYLATKNVISSVNGKLPAIKVLGSGELTKALTFEGCKISASAKDKIVKAGGSVK
jgi:large subunit ribosomal protein L15